MITLINTQQKYILIEQNRTSFCFIIFFKKYLTQQKHKCFRCIAIILN